MEYDLKKSLYIRDNNFSNDSLFSEIELNLSRICNKNCISCPHSLDEYVEYNKQNVNFMHIDIVSRVIENLEKINFKGLIDIAGMGEPTLNPHFFNILKAISDKNFNTRVITNGVFFKKQDNRIKLKEILSKNININIVFSAYNSSDFDIYNSYELGEVKKIFIEENFDIIKKEFNLNNRGGILSDLNTSEKFTTCNYCFFMLFIDTDGDIQFCPHQWTKKLTLGNILQDDLITLWNSNNKLRNIMLNNERQNFFPCNTCSTNGTLIGNEKRKYFEKK